MTRHRCTLLLLLLAVQSGSILRAEDSPTPIVLPIVNGVPSSGFPSVGMLVQTGGTCSATLIGCRTVLTAAHCICGALPAERCKREPALVDAQRFLLLQHGGIAAVARVDIDPEYVFPKNDLAVLHLAAPVTGIAPSSINTSGKPAFGTKGTIAGFGMGEDGYFGVKRSGQVRLTRCFVKGVTQADHDCWLFDRPIGNPGTNSTTCFGDSGGPLFTTTPTGLAVSGVHSAADFVNEVDPCSAPLRAIDSDVFVRRNWIVASAAEDLGTASCGGLPAAGTAQAPVLSRFVTFNQQKRTSRLSFNVVPGTAKLRASLNSAGFGGYELYLNHGAEASPSQFVCKAQGYLAFKYCEVDNPDSGIWHLLAVKTFGFGGSVQETVTRYLTATPP